MLGALIQLGTTEPPPLVPDPTEPLPGIAGCLTETDVLEKSQMYLTLSVELVCPTLLLACQPEITIVQLIEPE